jgi:hypothetical protein
MRSKSVLPRCPPAVRATCAPTTMTSSTAGALESLFASGLSSAGRRVLWPTPAQLPAHPCTPYPSRSSLCLYRPTGAVRASLGSVSTFTDAYALLALVRSHFVEAERTHFVAAERPKTVEAAALAEAQEPAAGAEVPETAGAAVQDHQAAAEVGEGAAAPSAAAAVPGGAHMKGAGGKGQAAAVNKPPPRPPAPVLPPFTLPLSALPRSGVPLPTAANRCQPLPTAQRAASAPAVAAPSTASGTGRLTAMLLYPVKSCAPQVRGAAHPPCSLTRPYLLVRSCLLSGSKQRHGRRGAHVSRVWQQDVRSPCPACGPP